MYIINEDKCVQCGVCADVCANGAITLDTKYIILHDMCFHCGQCADTCPQEAIEKINE